MDPSRKEASQHSNTAKYLTLYLAAFAVHKALQPVQLKAEMSIHTRLHMYVFFSLQKAAVISSVIAICAEILFVNYSPRKAKTF